MVLKNAVNPPHIHRSTHWQRWLMALACVAAAPALWATTTDAKAQGKALARMSVAANDEFISVQDVEHYLLRRFDLKNMTRNAWGVEQVVREMALTRVLNLEGESAGVPRKASRPDVWVDNARFDDVYAMAVQKKLEPACPRPANEQEARQYFDAHPQAFMVPVQARVQRIKLPLEWKVQGQVATDWLAAQARAMAVGTTSFAAVAESAQQAYAIEAQGDLGWIELGDADNNAVIASLRDAAEGETLGPLRVGEYVYLLQLSRKREARQLDWDDVKTFAATRSQEYCRTSGQEQLRDSLFQKYGVRIEQAAIRAFAAEKFGQSAADKR